MRNSARCRVSKPLSAFYFSTYKNKRYPRTLCRVCENRQREERRRASGKVYDERSRRYGAKVREMRKNGQQTARWVLEDSRRSDRKHGYENDLTKEFIEQFIAAGCAYCGATNLRMTLDRIDNSRGHTRDNVNPACIRCNYLRRDMLYAAWMRLAPMMRSTQEEGLFGAWTGRCR